MDVRLDASTYIDNTHYRVSDRIAGQLAREVGAALPRLGHELRVTVNGKPYWLNRTPISRHPRFANKRGWVWCVYSATGY